jgi:hypothetical protein
MWRVIPWFNPTCRGKVRHDAFSKQRERVYPPVRLAGGNSCRRQGGNLLRITPTLDPALPYCSPWTSTTTLLKKSRRRRRRCNSCHPWAVDLKDTTNWNRNSHHPTRKIISSFFSWYFLFECIGLRCTIGAGTGAWMDYRLLVGRRATVECGCSEQTCMWIEVLGGRMIHATFV